MSCYHSTVWGELPSHIVWDELPSEYHLGRVAITVLFGCIAIAVLFCNTVLFGASGDSTLLCGASTITILFCNTELFGASGKCHQNTVLQYSTFWGKWQAPSQSTVWVHHCLGKVPSQYCLGHGATCSILLFGVSIMKIVLDK